MAPTQTFSIHLFTIAFFTITWTFAVANRAWYQSNTLESCRFSKRNLFRWYLVKFRANSSSKCFKLTSRITYINYAILASKTILFILSFFNNLTRKARTVSCKSINLRNIYSNKSPTLTSINFPFLNICLVILSVYNWSSRLAESRKIWCRTL